MSSWLSYHQESKRMVGQCAKESVWSARTSFVLVLPLVEVSQAREATSRQAQGPTLPNKTRGTRRKLPRSWRPYEFPMFLKFNRTYRRHAVRIQGTIKLMMLTETSYHAPSIEIWISLSKYSQLCEHTKDWGSTKRWPKRWTNSANPLVVTSFKRVTKKTSRTYLGNKNILKTHQRSRWHCPVSEVNQVKPTQVSIVPDMCKLMTNNHWS